MGQLKNERIIRTSYGCQPPNCLSISHQAHRNDAVTSHQTFGKKMTMQFDTIDISLHHQEGCRPGDSGSPERFTVDFVVNGESLYSLLDVAKYGHASRFAADFRDHNQEAVDVFLMKNPPDIEGRAILYECSLCADSGCGVFLVKITRSDHGYVWSEFGYDQGWGDDQIPQLDLEKYKDIGPFTFEAEDYEQTIKRAAEQFVDDNPS